MKPLLLRIIQGPEMGREFELSDSTKLVVGRGSASDTKINDPRVSRVHCEVEVRDGMVVVTAAPNAGDTLVDGKPVDQRALKPGEVFRIGDTSIRVDGGPGAQQDHETIQSMGGSALDKLIGEEFAHYKIDSLISRGRTGLIYAATDTEKNRPVAVKILLPRVSATEEQRERFVRAMKTMLPLQASEHRETPSCR